MSCASTWRALQTRPTTSPSSRRYACIRADVHAHRIHVHADGVHVHAAVHADVHVHVHVHTQGSERHEDALHTVLRVLLYRAAKRNGEVHA